MKKLVASRSAMQKFAAEFAHSMKEGRGATVIALTGELGAGKTTFTQGFLKSLGVKHPVISPTFVLMRHYDLKNLPYTDAYHIDCYRLEKAEELLKLGFKDLLKNPNHIILIEWPELMKKYLPKNTHWIKLRHGKNKNERTLSFRT